MSGLRRALALVAIEGIVVGIVALAIVLSSDHIGNRGVTASLALFIGWSFIGAGLFAWWRRPDNRFGVLMTAVGFAFFLSVLTASDSSLLFTIGVLFSSLYLAVFVHMLLAYPDGRIDSPQLRKVLAVGYTLSIVGPAVDAAVRRSEPAGSRQRRAGIGDPPRHRSRRLRHPRRRDLGAGGRARRLRPLRARDALAGCLPAAAACDGAGAVVGHLPARRPGRPAHHRGGQRAGRARRARPACSGCSSSR